MNNKWKKAIVLGLSGVMFATSLAMTACGGDIEKVDSSKTQLFIGNYNGGVGHEWLDKVKEEFETKYAETSFETGKKGVQLHINNDKSSYIAANLLSTIDVDREEIFFPEYVINYYDFVSSGKLYPITKFIKEEQADGTTIESRLSEEQKAYFNVNGEYYALPHYETYSGIVYDVDLFDSYLLYYADEGYGDTEGFMRVEDAIYDENGYLVKNHQNSKLSKGPDNIKGTMDDGLPATYEDFYHLCDKMKRMNITPISWTGKYDYLAYLQSSLWADYEGTEQISLNFNYEGTANNIVDSIDENGNVTLKGATAITPANGYELKRQAGKYYALKFVETLAKKNYYSALSTNLTQDHLAAQRDYIYSVFENKPIAMIVEGTWWENEAGSAFDDCVYDYGSAAKAENRRFSMMALPKVDESKLGKATYYDGGYSNMLVNATLDPKKEKAVSAFINFCYSDEKLIEFSEITGCLKGVSYDTSKVRGLSYYAKSVINYKSGANVFYPYSNAEIYKSNQSDFNIRSGWIATIGDTTENIAFKAFKKGVTAESYFKGIAVSETTWKNKYKDYIN